MKAKLIYRIIVTVSFAAGLLGFDRNASGATTIVLPVAGALQTAINNAAPNDTLVLAPGTYPDNVIFSQPVIVLRGTGGAGAASNAPVNLAGTVQIQGAPGMSSFQQIYFENSVTIAATNGAVTFVGCQFGNAVTSSGTTLLLSFDNFQQPLAVDLSAGSQTNLQAFDTSFNTLTVTSGKAVLKRCNILAAIVIANFDYGIVLNNGTAFEGIRLTNNYGIYAIAGKTNTPFTLVQSYVGIATTWSSMDLQYYKVWLGYNQVQGYTVQVYCDSVMIGNIFYESQLWINNYTFYADVGTIKAYNNVFHNDGGNWDVWLDPMNPGGVEFINNSFYSPASGAAFYANGSFPVHLLNDAFVGNVAGNGQPQWDVSYCVYDWSNISVGAPPGGFGSILGSNPSFALNSGVLAPASYFLNTNSPCIGNGSPSPVYNNRGTTNQNDVGFTGGPYLNPANYTNTSPMVYLLTGAPLVFPKGQTNIISVNVGAAAGN